MFQWMMLSASDVAGANTAINQLRRSAPEKSEANVKFFEERLLNYLAACDGRLKGRDYLVGEFSLADVTLYPFVAARRALIEQHKGFDHLGEWITRTSARAGVSRAMSVSTMRSPS